MTIFTVGGVVAPGQTLMEIVPTRAELIIKARVSPNDADDLIPGQETEVRIPAFHQRNMPIIHGRLTEVSADSFVDQKTGQRYFTAEVTVPPAEMTKILKSRGEEGGLKPGLPVEVIVPLKKRTALQYLFEPLQQTFWQSFREH
jgi:HlyD family secretion protein